MSEAQDIAGKEAENVLKMKEKMAEVNAILGMAAQKEGCSVGDLQWRADEFGAIHIRRRDGKKTL